MTPRPRAALVTGANRGIGLEVCRQLAARGVRTVLAARDRGKAERAAATLGQFAQAMAIVELDVTNADSILRGLHAAREQVGPIDILVNNAAILLDEGQDVLSVSADDVRRTFETNVFGAVAVAQAFVPAMIETGYGRVVNVSSTAGQLSTMSTYAPAYSMSKAALNAFTRQLAAATNGTGVLVNSVCPGWVRTDMGGAGAPRSVEQGADTIVWAAMFPAGGPTGQFFSNRRSIEW